MKTLILQNVSTKEIRTVIQAVALSDKGEYNFLRCDIDTFESFYKDLKYPYIPVGSVEFVRKVMEVSGIPEPEINPYPINEFKYTKRTIEKRRLGMNENSLIKQGFVKPCKVKQFNGFLYNVSDFPSDYIQEQLDVIIQLPDGTEFWYSSPVNFVGEWRYYIQNSNIVGYARYDENDEDVNEPDISMVEEYISRLEINHPYVLDFGVLDSGETALVEFNDFWAIGLYGNALSPKKYLEMLIERFEVIRGKND